MKMDSKSKTPKYSVVSKYQTWNEKRPDDASGLRPQTKTLDSISTPSLMGCKSITGLPQHFWVEIYRGTVRPRTQGNVPGQGLNSDRSRRAHYGARYTRADQ